MWTPLLNKLRYLLRGGRIDRDLAAELKFHQQMLAEDEERRGHSHAAAVLNARRRMGNQSLMAERAREAWILVWLDGFVRDLRHAARSFARSPGFTLAALLTLALGIGANAAMFTIVNSVLLRPLPYADPGRLAMIWGVDEHRGGSSLSALLEGDVFDIREASRSFERIEAFQANLIPISIGVGGHATSANAVTVTPGLFALLGREPLVGRTLLDDDRATVVLSHGYWQRQFGGDRSVVGREVTIGTTTATIVGVMPPGFTFPYGPMLLGSISFTSAADADLWVPMTLEPRRPTDTLRLVGALGRLAEGVTLEQARTDVGAITTRLADEHPATNAGWGATVVSPLAQTVSAVRPVLWLLLGGVGLVLAMACAGVANLLLARGVRRRQEMAIRAAIGAGRGRLLRQALTESALLASVGAVASWAIVIGLIRSFTALAPAGMPRLAEIGPDWRVAAYTAALAVLAALAAGWLPAIAGTSGNPAGRAARSGRGSSASGTRLRAGLVVAEVALAVVLAFGTGLLVRSFVTVLHVDPGFRTEGLLTMQVAVPRAYDTPDTRRTFYSQLFRRLEAVPGVSGVGGTTRLPLGGANSSTHVTIEGRNPLQGGSEVGLRRALHDYFDVMQIPIVRGRAFTAADGPRAPAVVVINQTMAAQLFPGDDPIGKRVRLGENAGIPIATIVGIVGDVRHEGLEAPPMPEVYVHYLQNPPGNPLIVLRTASDPASLGGAVRAAARDVDPGVLTYDTRTMTELRGRVMAERRFLTAAAAVFGVLALVLATIGVYGVIALSVSERTREIGIRVALGAGRGELLAMVVRQGLGLAGLGLAIGLPASLALAPLLASQLYGVAPGDLVSLLAVVSVLGLAALAACVVPASRALRVDPVKALRAF
jgi:putative ABC transport system permease protein